MKRFLGLALMLMGAVLLVLPVGCSNNLPSASTGAVASTSPSTVPPPSYTETEAWYSYPTTGSNYTYEPWGIGILPNGNLAVVDAYYGDVQIMSKSGQPTNGSSSTAVSDFGFGTLSYPYGLTVDVNGNIWVADSGNYRILEMSPNGTILAKFGHYGTDGKNGDFEWPDGVAFDSRGTMYVLDYYTGVQVFQGLSYKASWGNGSFSEPYGGIASDGTNVFIADTYHYQLKKYTPQGKLLKAIGTYGTGASQFEFISGVAVDSKGNVYSGDYDSGIQKFDNDLNYETTVATPGNFYYGAYTMTVDPKTQDVYATDYYYYIYKFAFTK